MQTTDLSTNTKGWLFFVKFSFVVSILAMFIAIFIMPGELMLKGYMALNSLFIISSTIMVSKTLRDEHEGEKIQNKISEAKANKIIQEYAE